MDRASVRVAEPADFRAISAIFAEVDRMHEQAHPDLFRQPEQEGRLDEYLLGLVDGPNSTMLVAELGGEVTGFVTVEVREAPPVPVFQPRRFGAINTMAVVPGLRRQGIGRLLFAAAESWAAARGATEIELSVYEFNQGAVRFYEALGYGTVSRRMRRKLSIG
jgi:ribosomal protein S18 acetylase RimI-like enzyme